MSGLPRILPLVGVAAAGVLALNALSGVNGAQDLFIIKAVLCEKLQTIVNYMFKRLNFEYLI